MKFDEKQKNLVSARVSGTVQKETVANSHKTPIMEADKVDFIDMSKNNQEMQFSKWQEYLIKLACSIFCIDPSEVNFNVVGPSGNKPLFEGNNEARLKQSRDRGLQPILKFLQKRVNKFLVGQFYDGKYELCFEGISGMTPQEEADLDTKLLHSTKTINEVRRTRGEKDLPEGGDILLDSVYTSNLQMQQQNAMQNQQGEDEENQEETNPITQPEEDTGEDVIGKAFNSFIEKLNREE